MRCAPTRSAPLSFAPMRLTPMRCENQHSTCQTLPEKRAPRSSAAPQRNRRRHGRPFCSAAPSCQASKPVSGTPKARGLTAKVRAER